MTETVGKEIMLEGVDPRELYGAQDVYLEQIKSLHPTLKIVARGQSLKVLGPEADTQRFAKRMEGLAAYYVKYGHVSAEVIEQCFAGGIAQDDAPVDKDVIVYGNNGTVVRLTRKNNGELHKSTTMMFFDETGAYEAMLCFTVNLTALDQAKKMLDSLMNVMPFDSPEAMGSDLTIADYSKLVIADIIKTVGKPSALGSKEVKLRILRKLEEKGVFQLKDSVPQVCELLDISQATLYNYLREIRAQGSGFLPLSQK